MDGGDHDVGVVCVGDPHGVGDPALLEEVELPAHRGSHLRDDLARTQTAGDRPHPLDDPRQRGQQTEVVLHLLLDPRTLDLDRHRSSVGQRGAMDLRERGRGKRLGLEVGEQARERRAQLLLPDPARALALERGHPFVEARERSRVAGGNDSDNSGGLD